MKYTGFIVQFEYHDNTSDEAQTADIKVYTTLHLNDKQECDDYVIGNDINVKCMNEFCWNSIEDWTILAMFEHDNTETSFEPLLEVVDIIPTPVFSGTVSTLYDEHTAAEITKSGREAMEKFNNLMFDEIDLKLESFIVDCETIEIPTLQSTIENNLAAITTPLVFLKTIFGDAVNHNEPLVWNGIEHMYISSGSSRDVYVDPTWSYVIKKANSSSSMTANQFNAIEVWDYWNTKSNEELPKVPTRLISNEQGDILIQQDFLIVLNTGRVRINEIFKDVFVPENNNVTDVYGYQYGWNRKSQRVELYDTSDAYLGRQHISNAFEKSYSLFDEEFKDFDCFAKIHFYEEFVKFAKSQDLWQQLIKIAKYPECYLAHQDGLLFNHTERTITICGEIFKEHQTRIELVVNAFLTMYKPDENYFKATISNNLLT